MNCKSKIFVIPSFSPEILLSIAAFFSEWQGTVLLYSGGTSEAAERSFLGLFPYEITALQGMQLTLKKGCKSGRIEIKDPWNAMNEYLPGSGDPFEMAFGWLSYEMGKCADGEVFLPSRRSSLPDAYWQCCALVINCSHQTNEATVAINLQAVDFVESKAKEWIKKFLKKDGFHQFLKELPLTPTLAACELTKLSMLQGKRERESYLNKVHKAQTLIRDGEIYQVNLAQQFNFKVAGSSSFSLFYRICCSNPAPFSAYFFTEYGAVISTSP